MSSTRYIKILLDVYFVLLHKLSVHKRHLINFFAQQYKDEQ